MKGVTMKKALALVTGAALSLSLLPAGALAAEQTGGVQGSFTNLSEDGGENIISLCDKRTFKAVVPVELSQAEAEAAVTAGIVWSLDYDQTAGYLDPEQYPNHVAGGALDTFQAMNGQDLFTDLVTGVEMVEGKTCLTLTFSCGGYFYKSAKNAAGETVYTPDLSVRHSSGGSYMDLSGWYDLTATATDGAVLGKVEDVKIAPYDQFHTMKEIYEDLDAVVDFAKANTELYVVKESMGSSQGDNGLESLDMPYLIVAKSQKAVEDWKAYKAESEADPAGVLKKLSEGKLDGISVPVLYSNIHANETAAVDGVMGFAWKLVKAAAGEKGAIEYDTLTGFTAAGEAALAKQMGPKGEKDSVAVPDLVADKSTFLGFIKGNGTDGSAVDGAVSPWDDAYQLDLEKYYDVETVSVKVEELLEDVFFLIVPEENVEGRTYLTRTSSGGFDLNRDNSFQTQAETQNMTAFIAQWNPVTYAEFHGRGEMFQFEPCDPPHEPNFEYDLLAEHLMAGGEAMAIASVANNELYNSYVIPQRDYLLYTGEKTADGAHETIWADPWDDMSTSYTPQYSMLHGTVAYTVEMAAYNDACATAVSYGMVGLGKYVADNKLEYLTAQAKIFQRGVTNANSNAFDLVGQWFCDVHDVEGAEAEIFRPVYDGEGQNGNFYPECYIIPLDGANQKNLKAAQDMVTYLQRNGVTVQFAGEGFSYGGAEYPAGTAVVSMYQAKRSVANGVLYDGTVITGWPVLYSEGITAFNKTRGFDMAVCAEPEAYKSIAAILKDATEQTVVSDQAESEKVVLKNTSLDAVAAVNELLKAGKLVNVITDGEHKGSFLVSKTDYESVSGKYLLTAAGVETIPQAKKLTKAPMLYLSGKPADNAGGFVKATLVSGAYEYNYDRQAVAKMGFETTQDASQADLIIGAAALDQAALEAVKSGTPYIGYGRKAIPSVAALFEEGELVRNVVSDESMDALAYVTYPTESMVTASYVSEGDDILYGYGAGYFAAIPQGAEVLVKLDGTKEPLEGFLCADGEHYADFLKDSVQAIRYKQKGLDLVLFANTLTNKVHQEDEFGFIANAAFAAVTGFADVAEDAWYAETVDQAVAAGMMEGTSFTTFEPEGKITLATLCQTLYNLEGKPTVTGTTVDTGDAWYHDAVNWASQQGLVNLGESYPVDELATRVTMAGILHSYCTQKGVTVEGTANVEKAPDYQSIDKTALPAMSFCLDAGLMTGNENGELMPGGILSRAELCTVLLRLNALAP